MPRKPLFLQQIIVHPFVSSCLQPVLMSNVHAGQVELNCPAVYVRQGSWGGIPAA